MNKWGFEFWLLSLVASQTVSIYICKIGMIIIQPSPKTVERVRGDHVCDTSEHPCKPCQLSFMHWRSRNLHSKEGGKSDSRGGSTLGEDVLKVGFPGGSVIKEPTCWCKRHRRPRFDPWVSKIPWRRKWRPTPAFLPGESCGQRRRAGCSSWGHAESDTTGAVRTHTPTCFLKGGHGRCSQQPGLVKAAWVCWQTTGSGRWWGRGQKSQTLSIWHQCLLPTWAALEGNCSLAAAEAMWKPYCPVCSPSWPRGVIAEETFILARLQELLGLFQRKTDLGTPNQNQNRSCGSMCALVNPRVPSNVHCLFWETGEGKCCLWPRLPHVPYPKQGQEFQAGLW